MIVTSKRPSSDQAESLKPDFEIVVFRKLTNRLGIRNHPTVVLTSVIAADFDVFEVAAKLIRGGVMGELRAITARRENMAQIQTEISDMFPTLNFRILMHADGGKISLI